MLTSTEKVSNKNLMKSESPKVQRTIQACLPYYSNSNKQTTTVADQEPIMAIAWDPINTVTSFTLTTPKGESIVLLGHKNCNAALIGSRILTLFGISEQNINNGTISALFTTIGDQVQLNLPDGWSLEIRHDYNTLAQSLNLYRPQVLAQAPAASPAVASCTNAATPSARLALTNASRLGGAASTKKRRLALAFASDAKRP